MQMNVTSALRPAWDFMVKVLFRPFVLWKWLVWGFIVIMAMEGTNYVCNYGASHDEFSTGKEEIHRELYVPFPSNYSLENCSLVNKVKSSIADNTAGRPEPLMPPNAKEIPAVLFSLALGFLVPWLSSVFSFVYVDNLCKDSYAIREPFSRLRGLGTSYFLWNLGIGMLGIGILAALMALTVRTHAERGNGLSVPFVTVGLLMLVVLKLAHDFVVPAMYARRIRILEAWRVVLGILRANMGQVALYFLLIILIEIPTAIVIMGVCWLMMHVYSPILNSSLGAGPDILKAIFYAANYWLLRSAVQPVLVFCRAFPMAVMGGSDPSLITTPISSTPSEFPTAEEDD